MEQKPQIPTLKDSQKPQVKIKGLAARLSLIDRLKQFKKKDLAFILAGLGVLFMAPLAEHFMMSPENADTSTFKPGWGFQPSGRFGDGSSPYEGGVNGMAPGGVAGGGGDVITPLNVRDPSALVMGPGAQQQPAATSVAPPPPAKENTDWKDAISNAASKGASAATKAASLPVPKANLTNAGLRGLGVASGGGGGSYSLPPIGSSAGLGKAAGSNALQGVTKAPGYMGVGARGGQNSNASSLEALKKAAERAGTDLNRSGGAATNAETAAGRNMPVGGGDAGAGQGSSGKDDKGPGGNQDKGAKSLGESLEFLAAKDNQQRARDLDWKLKEKAAMRWPNLEDKLLEEAIMTPFKALTGQFAEGLKGIGAFSGGAKYWCQKVYQGTPNPLSPDKVSGCGTPAEAGKNTQYCVQGGKIYLGSMPDEKFLMGEGCSKGSGGDASNTTSQTGGNAVTQVGPDASGNAGNVASLEVVCQHLLATLDRTNKAWQPLKDATDDLSVVRFALYKTAQPTGCAGSLTTMPKDTVKADLAAVANALTVTGDKAGLFPRIKGAMAEAGPVVDGIKVDAEYKATAGDPAKWTPLHGQAFDAASLQQYNDAKAAVEAAGRVIVDARAKLTDATTKIATARSEKPPEGSEVMTLITALDAHLQIYTKSDSVPSAESVQGQMNTKVGTDLKNYVDDFAKIAQSVDNVNKADSAPAQVLVSKDIPPAHFTSPAAPETAYSVKGWNDKVAALKTEFPATETDPAPWKAEAAKEQPKFDATKAFLGGKGDAQGAGAGQLPAYVRWGDTMSQGLVNLANQCPPAAAPAKTPATPVAVK